jgi:Do/DeqQ family serine protease
MIFMKSNPVLAAVFTIVGLVAGLTISSAFTVHQHSYAEDAKISKEALDILSKTNQAMSEVVSAVKPSVVNISSVKTVKMAERSTPFSPDPFFKKFFGDEFRNFDKPREQKRSGLGSGVIVDKNGYILTNNHVIRGADEIKVTLSDKREFKGKVIGTDQKTDLAVIKIESDQLPVLRLGDSDNLKIGETVLAIGNPFGLNQTVTTGIVSATGRANVGIADYEDFIQTDAAINPGNSGGALVNIRGELIGINTAIFSTSGGYQGIGFAIPSNMAKDVMKSLIKNGKVVRGWLGLSIQPLTNDLVKQFNLRDDNGALVGDVVEDSPAEKAGIQRGDVIIEFNGREVKDVTHLRNMVADSDPGKEVTVKLSRDGNIKTVEVKIAEMPSEIHAQAQSFDNQFKGVSVQSLTPQLKDNLTIPKRVTGVVITDIDEDSPVEGTLMKNDIIMEINRKRISSIKDYEEVVAGIHPDENTLVLIFRKGAAMYITLSAK